MAMASWKRKAIHVCMIGVGLFPLSFYFNHNHPRRENSIPMISSNLFIVLEFALETNFKRCILVIVFH